MVLVIALAMGFTYTNGFHDASNAVATSVSTRALTPRVALALAAVMNLFGGFLGVRVAQTIGSDIIAVPMGGRGVAVCAGALLGAIAWNLLTWWRGMPSSSSHALIGGLGGAALAAGASVKWDSIIDKVLLPMLLSPLIGLVGVATGLAMWWLGLPNPLLWGAIAFLLNYVPILGPLTGVVMFLALGLLSLNPLWKAFMPMVVYGALHLVEGETITPMLLARRFTLNPVLVMIALLFWYWMWGVPGAILAVPMLAITKIICDRVRPLAAFGHFLEGEKRSLRP